MHNTVADKRRGGKRVLALRTGWEDQRKCDIHFKSPSELRKLMYIALIMALNSHNNTSSGTVGGGCLIISNDSY